MTEQVAQQAQKIPHKYYYIGGGITLLLVILYIRKRAASNASSNQAPALDSSIPTGVTWSPMSAGSAGGDSGLPAPNLTPAPTIDVAALLDKIFNGQSTNTTVPSNPTGNVPVNSNHQIVDQLYHNLLNRGVESAGDTYWSHLLESGSSISDVMTGIENSPEYKTLHPAQTQNQSPDVITQLYSELFHRAPDAAGQAFWSTALTSGATIADVVTGMENSPEYKAAHPMPTPAPTPAPVQTVTYVPPSGWQNPDLFIAGGGEGGGNSGGSSAGDSSGMSA